MIDENLRAYALDRAQVVTVAQKPSWPRSLSTACSVLVVLMALDLQMRDKTVDIPPRAAIAFDGYPLIGPGMTCWFKELRREGQLVVYDLCHRFLAGYERYHQPR